MGYSKSAVHLTDPEMMSLASGPFEPTTKDYYHQVPITNMYQYVAWNETLFIQ